MADIGHFEKHFFYIYLIKLQKNNKNLLRCDVSRDHQLIDFLFDFNKNYVSIFCRFRDIAGYLSKVADFDPPHLNLAPSNFAEIFGVRQRDSVGYREVLFL